MNLLSFAGALRTDSTNKKLAREAVRLVGAALGPGAEFVDLVDFPMPLYNGDQERDEGLPASVRRFAARIAAADGLIIATPEYNGGMSSVLKNAVDWLSRVKPMPLKAKHLLLLSASPGRFGGVRGLWHSRVPFEALGVHVFPEMMSVANAGSAFDPSGRLAEEPAQQLRTLVCAFADHACARGALAPA